MLISLALVAQTLSLSSDPAQAAMTCAQAASVSGAGQGAMRITSQISYYVMQAAKADPSTKPFLDKVAEIGERQTAGPLAAQDAPALIPECDRRFPLARSAATPRLPEDPYRRDFLCLSVLTILKDTADAYEEDSGDAGPLDKIETALAPIADRLSPDVLKTHGIDSQESFTAAVGKELEASLALGNTESLARACGAPPF